MIPLAPIRSSGDRLRPAWGDAQRRILPEVDAGDGRAAGDARYAGRRPGAVDIVRPTDGSTVAIGRLVKQNQTGDNTALPGPGDVPRPGLRVGNRRRTLSDSARLILCNTTVTCGDQRLSRHGEPAEVFRAALARRPATGIRQMRIGVSPQALGRPVEAIEAFRRARDGTGLTPELRAFVEERVAELQR